MQSSLTSLIVAVVKRNYVEYTQRISSLSANQFTKSLISSDSQRLTDIVLWYKLCTKFHTCYVFGFVEE